MIKVKGDKIRPESRLLGEIPELSQKQQKKKVKQGLLNKDTGTCIQHPKMSIFQKSKLTAFQGITCVMKSVS